MRSLPSHCLPGRFLDSFTQGLVVKSTARVPRCLSLHSGRLHPIPAGRPPVTSLTSLCHCMAGRPISRHFSSWKTLYPFSDNSPFPSAPAPDYRRSAFCFCGFDYRYSRWAESLGICPLHVCLISLYIISSRFIRAVACVVISFMCKAECTYHVLFMHSSVDGYSGYSYLVLLYFQVAKSL